MYANWCHNGTLPNRSHSKSLSLASTEMNYERARSFVLFLPSVANFCASAARRSRDVLEAEADAA